ncbi:SpoIIE family protein phosphatase [Streptomyces sp. NPDC015661]|uniref:SpoIIE family protein phosphatase n=1 Tax=Streptomyces sp. NPDC015661 TaxID=3364961 RepID=UPI0036FEA8FA
MAAPTQSSRPTWRNATTDCSGGSSWPTRRADGPEARRPAPYVRLSDRIGARPHPLLAGDVVGHGLRAAASMGRLRMAVRPFADVGLMPDELADFPRAAAAMASQGVT